MISPFSGPDRKCQFDALSSRVKACHKCEGLNIEGVTESAPGFGNLLSRIAIIGQSLCKECMKTQIPFTGGCGRVLDQAFKLSGIRKSDVFMTNVVHCHTPRNRESLPSEVANCRQYLLEELEIVKPRAIVTLGKDASTSLLGESCWPSLVGKDVRQGARAIYPLYHPSYILRLGSVKTQRYVDSLAGILRSHRN